MVQHPECRQAEQLAARLSDWFRQASMSVEAGAAGLPIDFRRHLAGTPLHPPIRFEDAGLSYAEIARACTEAAKAAILTDRRDLSTNEIQAALGERQAIRQQ